MEKTITLRKVGYKVRGSVDVAFWGGGSGQIEMKPYKIDEVTNEAIIAGINDNGFGVQEITHAYIEIDELYERGVTEYYDDREYDKEAIAGKGKKGI